MSGKRYLFVRECLHLQDLNEKSDSLLLSVFSEWKLQNCEFAPENMVVAGNAWGLFRRSEIRKKYVRTIRHYYCEI